MNSDFEDLADALSGIQVDVWGDLDASTYLLTHFHYDHAAYEFKNPKMIKAHLSQCKTLPAMELFAPPTITNRYRQLGLNVVHDESVSRLLLNHPDRNNSRLGLSPAKTTSYVIGKILWIAEMDMNGLRSRELANFLEKKAKAAEWVAVPPPDEMHYLDRVAVNEFVAKVRKLDKEPFTYAHAFLNTEKWQGIVKYTNPTGIGISHGPPEGTPVLPQAVKSFRDILGGRYHDPAVATRR
jgi:hypothetical protein